MARTATAKTNTVEAKALSASSKSEGMRMLFEAGYTVSAVTRVMGAPYGFVYGVAKRAGFAESAAKRKGVKAVPATKATAKPKVTVRKVASATKPATNPVSQPTATARVAAKIASKAKAEAKRPGRPTAERRIANRKPRTQATKA